MVRSSPEKLAAALRANLKRRKEAGRDAPQPPPAETSTESAAPGAKSPPKPAPG
jgi:hypothetical protein